MKMKSTKHALLVSALALLMCVSMLVGSTFAWFTDSVTSGNNKIVAGTLQIDLELLEEDGSWTSIKKSGEAIFDYENWEPGYTAVKILRVSNKGTLALKWLAKFVSDYELSPLADVIDVYVNTTVDEYPVNRSDLSGWTKVGTVKEFVNTISATTKGTLEAGAFANLGIALKMQENAGNEYQGMSLGGDFDIQIIATQYTSESDSFDNQYDLSAAIYVDSAAAAQAALDNAKKGDVIVLAPGNYGTLVFGQNADSKVVDITSAGGDAEGNEHYSKYEDITILGTTGAVVDQIDFEVSWIENSGASYVDITNLTIDGVTFSGKKTAINMDGHKGSALGIDGLLVKNCKMVDTDGGQNRLVFQQITGYKALNDKSTNEYVMTTGIKNLTITDCVVEGAHQVIESRPMENLTITNNTFKGIKERDMLITADAKTHPDVTYTGAITITGNTSIAGEERFVRASLNNSNAVVVIKDNNIIAYKGGDADYIKVEGASGTKTIENNPITYGSTKAVQAALDNAVDGAVIQLAPGNFGTIYFRQSKLSTNIDGWNFSEVYDDEGKIRTIRGVTIIGAEGAVVDSFVTEAGGYYNTPHSNSAEYPILDSFIKMENITVEDVTFSGDADAFVFKGKIAVDGLNITNCVMNSTGASVNKYVLVKVTTDGRVHEWSGINGETFAANFANVTIDGCEASNLDRFILAHFSKNLTVTNNKLTGADEHFVNLQGGIGWTVAHTGSMTFTGNTVTNVRDRFLRAASVGDANLVIERNEVFNPFYDSTENDINLVKVTKVANTELTVTDVNNAVYGNHPNGSATTFVPTIE